MFPLLKKPPSRGALWNEVLRSGAAPVWSFWAWQVWPSWLFLGRFQQVPCLGTDEETTQPHKSYLKVLRVKTLDFWHAKLFSSVECSAPLLEMAPFCCYFRPLAKMAPWRSKPTDLPHSACIATVGTTCLCGRSLWSGQRLIATNYSGWLVAPLRAGTDLSSVLVEVKLKVMLRVFAFNYIPLFIFWKTEAWSPPFWQKPRVPTE